MRSVCVNSPRKLQQHHFQPKNDLKAGFHNIQSCLSLCSAKPSTSLGQLQSPTLNSPIHIQKQRQNDHLAFNTKSKSLTTSSELVLVSTTIPSVNHGCDVEMSSVPDCLPMLTDWEDVILLPASQPDQNIDCTAPISVSGTSFSSGERSVVLEEPEMLSYENLEGIEKTPQRFETSKSIVYQSPHTTIYNVKDPCTLR